MVNKCYLAKNKTFINVFMTLDNNGNASKPTNPGFKNKTLSKRNKSNNWLLQLLKTLQWSKIWGFTMSLLC